LNFNTQNLENSIMRQEASDLAPSDQVPLDQARRGQSTTRQRHYLMCRPTYFDVCYSINPWMDPAKPAAAELAFAQWDRLRKTLTGLGHRVEVLEPLPGLPDMVFAANGAIARGKDALVARFRYAQRAEEAPAYLDWFVAAGYRVCQAAWTNEGEGDFLFAGRRILAGSGFRSDVRARREVQETFGLPVVGLTLVNPRFYHLDTALAVLDDDEIMYYPAAFSPASRAILERLYPNAVIATSADAAAFGLNAVSDGCHVILPETATGLCAQLSGRGFQPVRVDMSELLKAGGGAKCCVLELRS
jgi:N-dimethylarginine dimethylaminohydrolase